MTMMASGRLWQIARCLGARPGILLQMMLAPRATTEEKPLEQGTQREGALGSQGGAWTTGPPWYPSLATSPHSSQQESPNLFDTGPQPRFIHLWFHIGFCVGCIYNISEA